MGNTFKKAASYAPHAALAVLGDTLGRQFLGDGAGGIRDFGAGFIGALGGLIVASKVVGRAA